MRFMKKTKRKAAPVSRLKRRLRDSEQAARYLDDPFYRAEINLYFGTAVNAGYIILKFFSGVILRSDWMIVFALYYTVLTILRSSLIHYIRRNERKQNMRAEYRRYRLVGIMMLGLNVVLSGIVSRMIGKDEAYEYPGVLIYAMAAYTFYAVTLAIMGLFRFHRHGSPVFSAVKTVNLAAAIMALINLEAAMLHHFGGGDDTRFRHTMLGISGLGAWLILLCISVYMIVHASGELSRMQKEPRE